MTRSVGPRPIEAGVTLVEMLVVLVLVATLAGAVALSLPAARGADPLVEAELLAARMRRASEEALLAGAPVALAWDGEGYRFLVSMDGAWTPHPVRLLAETRTLPSGLALAGEGIFAVTSADLPLDGQPLRLGLGRAGADPVRAVAVTWDGATATVTEPAP